MIKTTDMFSLTVGDFTPSPPPNPRAPRKKRHPIGDLKPLSLAPLAPRGDAVPTQESPPSPLRSVVPLSPAAGSVTTSAPPDDIVRRAQLFQDLCAIEANPNKDGEAAVTAILKALQMAVSPNADCIVLFTTSPDALEIAGSTGGHLLVGQSFSITTCVAAKVLSSRKPLCISNLQAHASYYHAMDIDGLLGTRTMGYVAYPIILHGEIQGILELRSCHTSAVDIDLFLVSTVVPSIQSLWTAAKAPDDHTLLQRVASSLHTTTAYLHDTSPPRRVETSSAARFTDTTHSALQHALASIQSITRANAVYVFELNETTHLVNTIASTNTLTRATTSCGKKVAPLDLAIVTAALFQHTARPCPVAPLDVAWLLTGDASVQFALTIAFDSSHCVVCTAASRDEMEAEGSDAWLFVQPIAAQAWALDHASCREETKAGQVHRLTTLLVCTNLIWQAHDGGTKLGLLCTAGADFFGTSLFSIYVCDAIHNEVWAFSELGVSDTDPLAIDSATIVGACVEANECMVVGAAKVNNDQGVIKADDADATHSCMAVPIVDSNGHVIAVSQALFPLGGSASLEHLREFKSDMLQVFASTVATILMKSPTLLTYTKFQFDRKRGRARTRSRNDSAASFLVASGALVTSPSQRVLMPFNIDRFTTLTKALGRLKHRMHSHHESASSDKPHSPRRVVAVVASIATTDFDVFSHTIPQLHGLVTDMFASMDLLATFSIPPATFAAFLAAVEHHHRDVRYHNFYHAFSVTQMAYTLLAPNPVASVEDLDLIATLVACLGHDIDHPGHGNEFEVETASELALRYNDFSVLENHSIAVLFSILRDPVTNIFATLSKTQYATARATIVQCIIHTDMKYHADTVAHLTHKVDVSELEFQKQMFLNLVVHASDIGTLGHPRDAVLQWVDRILDEFQAQATKSEALGVPLASHLIGLDDKRTRCTVQLNFLNYIVLPLWTITAHLLPHAKPILDRMYSHREYFSQRINDE